MNFVAIWRFQGRLDEFDQFGDSLLTVLEVDLDGLGVAVLKIQKSLLDFGDPADVVCQHVQLRVVLVHEFLPVFALVLLIVPVQHSGQGSVERFSNQVENIPEIILDLADKLDFLAKFKSFGSDILSYFVNVVSFFRCSLLEL